MKDIGMIQTEKFYELKRFKGLVDFLVRRFMHWSAKVSFLSRSK